MCLAALAAFALTAPPAFAQSTTERVSVRNNGEQGNALSGRPAISGNGQFVAFYSRATNLVPSDTNGQEDVFVRVLPGASGTP